MKQEETSATPGEPRPMEALLAIALQLRAKLDAADGIRRNLGEEAVLLRKFGYRNPDIALIIGSTPGSVAELISHAGKSKSKTVAKKGIKRGKPTNKRAA